MKILAGAMLCISIFAQADENELRYLVREHDFSAAPMEFELSHFELREAEAILDPQKEVLLAKEYLLAHRLQEAIWTLRRGGFRHLAHQLTHRVIQFLKEAPILDRYGHHGFSAGKILVFPGGIKAMAKEKSGDGNNIFNNPAAEIWTYQLSEALELDIVPLTVWRKNASVQIFVYPSMEGPHDFKTRPYLVEAADLFYLDFIVQQKDRKPDNWLILPGNRRVAIDNSLTFGGDQGIEWREYFDTPALDLTDPSIARFSTFMNRKERISNRTLRNRLRGKVPEDVIESYIKRRKQLHEAVQKALRCDSLLAA